MKAGSRPLTLYIFRPIGYTVTIKQMELKTCQCLNRIEADGECGHVGKMWRWEDKTGGIGMVEKDEQIYGKIFFFFFF